MRYATNQDIPSSIRDHLPEDAQVVFRETFNHALEEYADPDTRRDPNDSQETVARKVAWAAVKQHYEKQGYCWVEKDEFKD